MTLRPAMAVWAVLVLAAAGTALAAQPEPGGEYKGEVSDCEGFCATVDLRVTHSGKRVKVRIDNWAATCESGAEFGGNNVYTGSTVATKSRRIDRHGRFSVAGAYTENPPAGYGGPAGTSARIAFKLRGRFSSRRKAKGFFKAKVVLTDSSGTVRDRCNDTDKWIVRLRS
jgi:hypothetical protein